MKTNIYFSEVIMLVLIMQLGVNRHRQLMKQPIHQQDLLIWEIRNELPDNNLPIKLTFLEFSFG